MAYVIVYKSGEEWRVARNTILMTPEEAAAFLAVEQRATPNLTVAVAELVLPPFAAQEAA